MKARFAISRTSSGCLLVALAVVLFCFLAFRLHVISRRNEALSAAGLSKVPFWADIERESEDGWHFETLEFSATRETIDAWIAASPGLRSRTPVTDSTGGAFYPCTSRGGDPDTPEGDCTSVSVSRDHTRVAIHLAFAVSANQHD